MGYFIGFTISRIQGQDHEISVISVYRTIGIYTF